MRKNRKNYYLSADCIDLMEELALYEGLNQSNIIEFAVRELYEKRIGPRPKPEKRATPFVRV